MTKQQEAKKSGQQGVGFMWAVAGVLMVSRGVSVMFNLLPSDCDETMNFYEPAHFLLHGRGLQTWEYSPRYALRSYFYLALHLVAPFLLRGVVTKTTEFLLIRSTLALLSVAVECTLIHATRKVFGTRSAVITTAILAFSPGMFMATTSFLPSSFSMEMVACAYALHLLAHHQHSTGKSVSEFGSMLCVCMAGFVAWPFSALAAVPLALSMLLFALLNNSSSASVVIKSIIRLSGEFISAALLVLIPLVAVDTLAYHKGGLSALSTLSLKDDLVVAPWNIFSYNVLKQPEGGSALYGVEPWNFFLLNGTLNFNVAWLLALLCLPFCLVSAVMMKKKQHNIRATVLVTMPVLLWAGFMSAQAHKEERFLFVVYPLIAVSAAICIDALASLLSWKRLKSLQWVFVGIVLAVFVALSVSRIMAVVDNYGASQAAWNYVSTFHQQQNNQNRHNQSATVCVGKEWYRFPTHFFLDDNMKLGFIRSEFKGELPQSFAEHTWSTPLQPFNDRNRMEPQRYVQDEDAECNFIVEQEFDGQAEQVYSDSQDTWEVVWSAKFLDAPKTKSSLARAFFVPGHLLDHKKVWARYVVLHNKKI